MPHMCINCGREFHDGSVEILKGCPSCGGKKFVYVSDRVKNDDILRGKTPEAIARETKQEVLEVRPERSTESSPAGNPADILERVESVRIMGRGKYELNLERMAESQDVIIGMGTDGRYIMDLASMSKPRKKK